MSSINTSVEFLECPHDPVSERGGYVSPWRRVKPTQSPSRLGLNTSVGHGSFPKFSSASQVSQSKLGPETRFESSFFQCANSENSQRQAVQSHKSIFQRANSNIDIPDQVLQSSSSPLGASQVLNTFQSFQNTSIQEKQSDDFICNESKMLIDDDVLPSSQPVVKRVPVFKAARTKTSGMHVVPENKGKKRLLPQSQEDPIKKQVGLSSFSHSQKSAFKSVSKNDSVKSAGHLFPLSSTKKDNNENDTSSNHLKTQPSKPKFGGKTNQCPNKKIKKEIPPDVTDPRSEQGNREVI